MRALSKQAEQRLLSAIEAAAASVNAGLDPNSAIVKSAQDFNIPAGHISLMVHAYNTGRTNSQRAHGENTYEKAADFQLASAEAVLAQLYPKTVKTSAEIARDATVSTEYAFSPRDFIARRQATLNKVAAALTPAPAQTYVLPPRDELAAARRAYSEKIAAQRQAEELRRVASVAYNKAAAAMDELANYFRGAGSMPFPDAVKQVELRLGPDGVNVLQKIAAVYPQFEKQASTGREYFGHDAVYDFVNNVITAVTDYVDVKKKLPEVKTAESAQKKNVPEFITKSVLDALEEPPLTLKEAAGGGNRGGGRGNGGGRPGGNSGGGNEQKSWLSKNFKNVMYGAGGEKPKDFNPGATFKQPMSSIGENIAFGNNTDLRGVSRSFFGLDTDPEKLRADAYKKLDEPNHEMLLKNIRAQATLHDLMLNDPIVSAHEPHEVAEAFNEIADVAPNVVQSPAVLQALLRKRLEAGQLADFDVKQLIDMSKLKAERDRMMLDHKNQETNLI